MGLLTAACPPQAVREDWYFQMYYDDLPVWGFIGKMEKLFNQDKPEFRYYLFTHIDFNIKYNDDRVIEISVSTDPAEAVDISENITSTVTAKFTYSVKWTPVTTSFDDRLQRYEKFPLDPVHLEVGPPSLSPLSHRAVKWLLLAARTIAVHWS